MAKFTVSAFGAHGDGLAFDHGDQMFDVSWDRDFANLHDAIEFAKTRKTGWAYTDNCDWRRRGVKFLHLSEYFDSGNQRCTWRFDVTPPHQLNVEVGPTQ